MTPVFSSQSGTATSLRGSNANALTVTSKTTMAESLVRHNTCVFFAKWHGHKSTWLNADALTVTSAGWMDGTKRSYKLESLDAATYRVLVFALNKALAW